MARTPSYMLPLGTKIPSFNLPDTDGKMVSNQDYIGKPLLVLFICNHCPFVIHVRDQLAAIGRDYLGRGLGIVAINSNDVEHFPDDSPEKMKIEKQKAGYHFPYLFDQTQEVAKSFKAACTPDIYLFNSAHDLAYRGQLDDSRPSNQIPPSGKDLRAAIEALLTHARVPSEQKPSLGCNIKWKPGQEPTF
jgi:thiol-disulfide isomerase/thioredoxin